MSSPVTPTPKSRNVASGAEDDVTRDASSVGSQTITPDKPLQPGNNIYGSGSHIEDLHQAQIQSHSHDEYSASTRQLEGSQDDDLFSDTGLHEAVGAARVEQETEATGSTDVVRDNAVSSLPVDAGQEEDSVVNDFVAPHVIDEEPCEQPLEEPLEEPHGEHGASTAASVPNTMETEPEKDETPVLEAIDESTQTAPLPHPQQQSPTDILGETTVFSSPIDKGLAEESTINNFIAPHMINLEPHEQLHEQEQSHEEHGSSTAAIGSNTMETEPEKEKTAVLETIDEDMSTVPPPHPQQQSPAQSFSIPDAQPASPKGKQVGEATIEPASDNDSAASSPDPRKGLVTIPIPPHYHEVRNYLWFKKSIAGAQPAPETQPGPRTPSPKKSRRKARGTSGAGRTRTSKKTSSKAPANEGNNWSPRPTRSAKKAANEAKEAEAAATQAASPPPARATPIKKITLHFTRKPKVESDDDAAPETEAEEEEEDEDESSRESTESSDEPGTEGGGFYDGNADELDPDADAEEEVMLL